MAVFQGARVRTVALPPSTPAVRRRADIASTVRSASRVGPVGLLLAIILTGTMLGFVYLTQTLGSNAASAELGRLVNQRETLDATLRNQSWAVEESVAPGPIVRRARDLGLVKLGDDVVLSVP